MQWREMVGGHGNGLLMVYSVNSWVVFHKLLGVASDFIHYPTSCTISYT